MGMYYNDDGVLLYKLYYDTWSFRWAHLEVYFLTELCIGIIIPPPLTCLWLITESLFKVYIDFTSVFHHVSVKQIIFGGDY